MSKDGNNAESAELEGDVEDEAEEDVEDEAEEDEAEVELDDKEEDVDEEQLPIGDKVKSYKTCKSCYSTRNFGKTLQQCSDMCSKDSKCKFFYFGHDHCGLCKSCDSTSYQSSYNVYEKWEQSFPAKNQNCKERFSELGRGKEAGCKKSASKSGYSFYAFKSKKCRRWKTCSSVKAASGWTVKKVR